MAQRSQDPAVSRIADLPHRVLFRSTCSLPARRNAVGESETSRDFREFRRCVVSGTAGQGKSILFRYLALQEILQHRLPIFVELRNLANFRDITELIQNELQNLGFDKHDEVFALLLHRPETTVFLDAFDEIPPNLQSKARKDIEDLTRRYPESTILVSSRPALNIESSPCFRVARISYLQNGEAIDALKRMCRDSDDPSTVESEVKKSNHELSQLLDTPLMVALLLLHYRLTQKFPETEQAFFRDLFDVLLRRHDQTKGYVRQRYSDATETELSDVFCYLSFCTRKLGEVELPRTRLIELGREAIKFAGHALDPAGAVDDIVHGTNLILEEGHTCRFAHKSIQEFYGALFLSRQAESHVKSFLNGRIKRWDVWSQFLHFSEIVDRYKFVRYFLVPHIGWLAYGDPAKRIPRGWNPSKKAYDTIFGKDSIGIRDGVIYSHGCAHVSVCYLLRDYGKAFDGFWKALRTIDWAAVKKEIGDDSVQIATIGADELRMLPMSALLQSAAGDTIRLGLKSVIDTIIPVIFEAYSFLDYRAEQDELFN
ncbi:MAG: NACHT domain-containing protein [Planctomycetaceae bacterium]